MKLADIWANQSLWARTYSVARLWPVFGSQNLMGCWLSLLPDTTNPFVGCQSTHFTSAPWPVEKIKNVHFEISQTLKWHWKIEGCTPYNCNVKLNEKHHRAQVTKHEIKLNKNSSELFRLHSFPLITGSFEDNVLKASSLQQKFSEKFLLKLVLFFRLWPYTITQYFKHNTDEVFVWRW